MALGEEIARIAELVGPLAAPDAQLGAVLPTEPHPGDRIYLCAFENDLGERSWLAVDGEGTPVQARHAVRDAVSIAALCEVAEEVAGGGELEELLSRLVALRMTESPEGIEEAEAAVLALQLAVGTPPELSTPARLDAIGLATRDLELALGGAVQGSPFADAMRGAGEVVDALTVEVERSYRGTLR